MQDDDDDDVYQCVTSLSQLSVSTSARILLCACLMVVV